MAAPDRIGDLGGKARAQSLDSLDSLDSLRARARWIFSRSGMPGERSTEKNSCGERPT